MGIGLVNHQHCPSTNHLRWTANEPLESPSQESWFESDQPCPWSGWRARTPKKGHRFSYISPLFTISNWSAKFSLFGSSPDIWSNPDIPWCKFGSSFFVDLTVLAVRAFLWSKWEFKRRRNPKFTVVSFCDQTQTCLEYIWVSLNCQCSTVACNGIYHPNLLIQPLSFSMSTSSSSPSSSPSNGHDHVAQVITPQPLVQSRPFGFCVMCHCMNVVVEEMNIAWQGKISQQGHWFNELPGYLSSFWSNWSNELVFFQVVLEVFFFTVLDPHPCQVSQMKSVWPDSSKGGWYEKPEPQCSGNDSPTIQKDFEGLFFSEIFWASVKDSIIFKVIKQPHMECCWSLSMYLQCCSLESHRLGQPYHFFSEVRSVPVQIVLFPQPGQGRFAS